LPLNLKAMRAEEATIICTLSNAGEWVSASFQGSALKFNLKFQYWMGGKGDMAWEIMVAHFILHKIVDTTR